MKQLETRNGPSFNNGGTKGEGVPTEEKISTLLSP
jgi:hypothetical protein